MLVLLVRHCHAGSKAAFGGEDEKRPLSARGRAAAKDLTTTLGGFAPERIISSPFIRCLQTVEPLAAMAGLRVELAESLRPDAGEEAVHLLQELSPSKGSPVVLCTHGEVIQDMQRLLHRRAPRSFTSGGMHEKASVWALRCREGRITKAKYLSPP